MNRGIRKTLIFIDVQDRSSFLYLLARTAERCQVRVHAYALMGNHYHLLVEVPRGNLSRFMQLLAVAYARYANDRHGWDGPLWRGRFRNRLVTDDAYWRHLFAYLDLNPVRAGLVDRPEEARWTSHRAYIGLEPRPDWLTTSDLLPMFGTRYGYRQYVAGVLAGTREAPEAFDEERLWVPDSTGRAPEIAWGGPPVVDDELATLSEFLDCPAFELAKPQRVPRHDPGKLLATWILHVEHGLDQGEVGELLGVSHSTVSRRLARFEELRTTDDALRELIRRWRDLRPRD